MATAAAVIMPVSGELRSSIRIVEILDGPYRGHIVRVSPRGQLFQVRPRYGDYPFEPYRLVIIDGMELLEHAPTPPVLLAH